MTSANARRFFKAIESFFGTIKKYIEYEGYTDVIITVRGGSVQSAHQRNGTPILVTVHDYDVLRSDQRRSDHNIDTDDIGDKFESWSIFFTRKYFSVRKTYVWF